MLMVYAFNNDIRFNSEGHFNLPVGKTDLNKMNINKIQEYIERINTIETEFICASFMDLEELGMFRQSRRKSKEPKFRRKKCAPFIPRCFTSKRFN